MSSVHSDSTEHSLNNSLSASSDRAPNIQSSLLSFSKGAPRNLSDEVYMLSSQELKKLPRARKIEILRELRQHPCRRPTVALMCATDLMAAGGGGSTLGDEYYVIMEQCLIAALDCGKHSQAQMCLKLLQYKFGVKSNRVRKLEGLMYEAQGRNDMALKIYAIILMEVPNDAFVIKRQVAIYKSTGDLTSAIDVLENRRCYKDEDGNSLTYQHVHALDLNTFKELTNLYLQIGKINNALFYAEECILCSPYDYGLHCRHGEIAYTNGQYDRAITAFSQSLRLNNSFNSARAAYGLLMASHEALKVIKKGNKSEGKGGNNNNGSVADVEARERLEAIRLHAAGMLRELYSGSNSAYVLDLQLKNMSL
eukprot:Tbor_TRINITY_DN5352_c2_g5::TRINITY_DN5352_c2_g5_i1::g.5125::m.5125